jgi:hypothetical protein
MKWLGQGDFLPVFLFLPLFLLCTAMKTGDEIDIDEIKDLDLLGKITPYRFQKKDEEKMPKKDETTLTLIIITEVG